MKKILPLLLLIFIAIMANAQWSQLGGPPGGNITDLERLASGKIYSVSNQTLYESSNNGVSWVKTTITTPSSNFSLDDLAVDASTGMLYAINYSVLYTSTDATNWTKVSTDGQFYGMYRITPFGPDGFIAISGWNGIYISQDGGVNWTKILDDNIYNNHKIIANAGGDLFAPTSAGIKRYLYPGAAGTFSSANWETVYTAPVNLYELSLGIDAANNLYAHVGGNDGSIDVQELLNSTAANNGNSSTWNSLIRTGITNSYFSTSWAKNGSKIYLLDNNGSKIYSSGGQATTTFGLSNANFSAGNNYIVVSNIGSLKIGDQISGAGIPSGSYVTDIYASNDFRISKNATANGSGVNLTATTLVTPWTKIDSPSSPYGSNMSNIVFISASNFVIGTDNDGFFYTTNSGASFSQASGLKFGNGTQIEVANSTGRLIYLTNYQSKGYWTSTNGGSTWSFVPLSNFVRKILKLNDGTLILYGSETYRSTDNGLNFTSVANTYIEEMREHPTIPGKLYAFNGCCIFSSVDGGVNWSSAITLTGMPASYNLERLTVTDTDILYTILRDQSDNKRYAYRIESGVATKFPGTTPWSEVEYFYANNIFIQNSGLYVSSGEAIYKTTDEGANWVVNNFSGDYVSPITQGSYSGIVISRYGVLYVTQDDGKTFNSAPLPSSNSRVTDFAIDLSGSIVASANNSPALKYGGNLTVDPVTLPPFIDFNWQPTNGPYGGYTGVVIKDNSGKAWALTNGKLYNTNTFVLWQHVPIIDQFGNEQDVRDFLFDDVSSKLFALTPNAIYTSTNGVAWNKLNTEDIVNGDRFVRLANGNFAYYTYSNGQEIYVSTDGGLTFGAPKYELSNENFDKIKATANAIFLNLYDNNTSQRKLLRSTDNGTNWTELTLPLSWLENISTDQTNLYVFNGSELWKSTDNGDNWTNIKGDNVEGIGFQSKVVTAPNGDLFFFGNQGKLVKSSNGGTNWTLVGTISGVDEIYDLTWVGTRMTLATNDGVHTSDDNGATFAKRSTGITGYNFNDLELIGNERLFAGGYTKPFVSNDFQNWASVGNGLGNYYYGVLKTPTDELIAWSCGEIYRSADSGQTWTKQNSNTCVDQLFTADGINFYNRQYEKIQYSTDLSTWTNLTFSGLPTTGYFQLVSDNNSIIYVLLDSGSGREAYQILFGSAIKLNFINNPSSLHNVDGKIIIYDSQGTIYETTNGSTWATKGAASGDKLIIASNNYYFVPSNGGVLWLSRDEGQSWQEVGFTAQSKTFTDVVVNEFDGYAYGSINQSEVRKSANIVIPDDATNPVVTGLVPANNSIDIDESTNLTITFDEPAVPQSGKTLKILDLANPIVALEIIDVTTGVQSGRSFTFTPTIQLDFTKTYFVVVDNGAFEDIFGNEYAGIVNNTSWRFTIREEPDTQGPVISLVTANLNLEKGVSKTFEVKVTDDQFVPTDKTKFWYRGITKLATTAFTSAAMGVSSGSGTTSANFTVTAQESWYDEMGIEFYIESEDEAGNITVFPEGAYNYSYINFPTGASPAFPAGRIAFGGRESDYRIISVPYSLGDAQVTTVLNELGSIDKTKWRMFTYDATKGEFSENPSSFERGRGYWINVRNSPGDILVEGATTPSNNRTAFFTLRLYKGWNQVGNPYPVAIDWSQVKAGNPNITDLKTYNGTTYANSTELPAFQGGFTFVNEVTSSSQPFIDLKIRFKDILAGGRAKEVLSSDLSENNWSVPIYATSNEITNTFGGVGMHEEANLEWDEYDDINPPRFLNYAELTFSGKNILDIPLAKNVVPTAQEFAWEFETISSEGVTLLSWDNASITGEKDLMLFDIDKQTLVNMKDQGVYSYSGSESKKFKIYFGDNLEAIIKPTIVSLGKPYPNPTRGASTINYTIPKSNNIVKGNLEVYNSIGRRITLLHSGNFEPGFYTASWDTESVHNGIYFYRLTVIDNDKAYSLTEKIIINR